MFSSMVMKVDEVVTGTLDHLKVEVCEGEALVVTNLRFEVLIIEPCELTAVIFELVSNERVLGEIGPDRLMPCEPPV